MRPTPKLGPSATEKKDDEGLGQGMMTPTQGIVLLWELY